MPKLINIGQKIGQLTVISFIGMNDKSQRLWRLLCDCGNTIILTTSSINCGKTLSCGCYRKKLLIERRSNNETNKRYGKLIALKRIGKDKWNNNIWLCKCDCGNYKEISSNELRSRNNHKCNKCSFMINGQISSSQQNYIHAITGGIINYKIFKYFVDIYLPDSNVVIEYNGWKWHKMKKHEDLKRNKNIKNAGFKLLIINGGHSLPSKNKILYALKLLQTTKRKQYTITLKDWHGYLT